MHGTKIATCCYCGTRAALVLRGETRHELSCSACGAPLHNLKMLPKTPERKAPVHMAPRTRPAKPKKPPKKRKTFGRKIFEEVFDLVEDIFD